MTQTRLGLFGNRKVFKVSVAGWDKRKFIDGETVPAPCADTELTFEDIYTQTPYL